MVVIPTYNGYHHLSRLVKSMETYGTDGHEVCIVDHRSNDIVAKAYIDELRNYEGPLTIHVLTGTEDCSYEAGAAIIAIREFPEEEKFLFLHDTCEATSDQWIKQFDERLTPENGAVAWIKFQPCLFCVFQSHRDYMYPICDLDNVPDSGIFGGIFYTYGSIMRELDQQGKFLTPPTNKMHSEAWERIWPILLHQAGYHIDHIVWGFNPGAIHHGHYEHLRKYFGGRQ